MIYLSEWEVFFSCSERLLAFLADVFELRIAIGEHIALDNPCIPSSCKLIAPSALDVGSRYSSTPGSENIFLHGRHLSFFMNAGKLRWLLKT
jgi:hypothetical protein